MAKKLVQLGEVKTPMFLSLVQNPANRSGFKIIRSEGQDVEQPTENGKFKAKRSRRMDSKDGMLYIELPTKFTEEQALAVMEEFGLEEDYELSTTDDYVRLVRSDMIAIEMPETVAIKLNDTSTAHVATTSFSHSTAARSDEVIGGAVLASIDFEGHSDEDVAKFLEEKNINIEQSDIEKIDDETFQANYRSDGYSPQGLRTDRVKLADGVTARIYRADRNDLPESIQRMVVEEAYGSYGYGQLDFYASLSDQLYTEAAYDAVYTLRSILEDITIYSGLNLTARVDLMNNALSQYGFYMAELMNSLPRSVVSVMTSDIPKNSTREDSKMAIEKKEETTTEDTKRSDDVVEEKKADEDTSEVSKDTEAKRSDPDEGNTGGDAAKEEAFTRSDAQAMIDDAVAKAVTAAVAAVRSDDKKKEEEPEAKAEETPTEETGDSDNARRDDAIGKLATSVEALASKVEELGDTSTVRSADTSAEGEEGSVFKGALFSS